MADDRLYWLSLDALPASLFLHSSCPVTVITYNEVLKGSFERREYALSKSTCQYSSDRIFRSMTLHFESPLCTLSLRDRYLLPSSWSSRFIESPCVL